MSGIAGWADFRRDLRNEVAAAESMNEALISRGRTAGGTCLKGAVLLCHRRSGGDGGAFQPLTRTVGGESFTLVSDCTLYNAAELRAELLGKGYVFSGGSDAELLLNAYIEWGEDCLTRLNGVYAFAVWREREKRLTLARDRIGARPLYFKALFACPACPAELDAEGVRQMFLLGPGKPCGSGVYRGVEELLPGEYLTFSPRGLTRRRYWKLRAEENRETAEAAAEHTRALMLDAVGRQLCGGAATACFLSGGLDSSLIACAAAERFRAEGKTLTTYSIDYEDSERDFIANDFQPARDAEYIRMMSKFIGSDHRETVLDNALVAAAVPDAARARDLPGMGDVDSSMLLACRAVAENHAVCLSGECADELFGGYPWYHKESLLYHDGFPWARSLEMRKGLLRKEWQGADPDGFVRGFYQETLSGTDFLSGESPHARRIREMFVLNFKWFMQTLLDRTDRMSACAGLEVRVPLADHRIVEYAYNLPWELKAADGREKGIMRRAFRGILPDEIIFRKKSPYPKTFSPVYVSTVREGVKALMRDKESLLPELIDAEYLQSLLDADPYKAEPWYGQLMRLPQVFAFLIQADTVLRTHKVKLIVH